MCHVSKPPPASALTSEISMLIETFIMKVSCELEMFFPKLFTQIIGIALLQ